jgi:hypothetical protein
LRLENIHQGWDVKALKQPQVFGAETGKDQLTRSIRLAIEKDTTSTASSCRRGFFSHDVCVRRNRVFKFYENQKYVLDRSSGEETGLHEDVERQIESLEVLDEFPHGSKRAKVQLQNVYLPKR